MADGALKIQYTEQDGKSPSSPPLDGARDNPESKQKAADHRRELVTCQESTQSATPTHDVSESNSTIQKCRCSGPAMAADQARSDKIWTGQLTTTFPRQQHLTIKEVNYLDYRITQPRTPVSPNKV